MEKITLHCIISGQVQGVGYRVNAKKNASQLGLTGWVRNLPDGNVEALVCGTKKKAQELCDWLSHGPKAARVDNVKIKEVPWEEHVNFEIR